MSVCAACGTKKEIHYGEFCPKCDKPVPKVMKVLDWFRCMAHLETLRPGIKARLWDEVMCGYKQVTNDCFVSLPFPDEQESGFTDQVVDDLKLLQKTFDINPRNTLFEVSW
jgi:hypothetical protein